MLNNIQRTAKSLSNYLEPVIGLIAPDYRTSGIKTRIIGIQEEGTGMFTLTLKPSSLASFSYQPGQHIPIQIEINGRVYQRTFSISSAWRQWKKSSTIEISIKRAPQGLVTNWIPNNLKKGHIVRIGEAQGAFVLSPKQRRQTNAFVACGSGLTPILSILESLSDAQLSSQHLLYSVSHESEAPFKNRLQTLAKKGLNLLILESSSQGRIKNDTLEAWLSEIQIESAYACGPSGLSQHIHDLFIERSQRLGHATPKFFTESFGFANASASSDVTLSFKDANGRLIISKQKNGTLLENAEKTGLNPVYGCRAGICHQCIAQKKSGRVRNLKTNQISDAGKEDIQLCICVAETDLELTINERTVQ